MDEYQTAVVHVLGVVSVLHDRLHELPPHRLCLLSPRLDPFGRPFPVPAVLMGHVVHVGDEGTRFVDPHMGRNTSVSTPFFFVPFLPE